MCLGPQTSRPAHRHPRLHWPGGEKRGLPVALAHLHRLLDRGLAATADRWPPIRAAYRWVHQAARILANAAGQDGATTRAAYATLLLTMATQRATVGTLAPAMAHFQKVTASYEAGLFHCYDVPDLPRTNNALEQCFGAVRYHERRTTGRKGAVPGLVVRGAVRVVAALATRERRFAAEELQLTDLAAWHELRDQLAYRQDARRAQLRFRRDPDAYLQALEDRLSQPRLPT